MAIAVHACPTAVPGAPNDQSVSSRRKLLNQRTSKTGRLQGLSDQPARRGPTIVGEVSRFVVTSCTASELFQHDPIGRPTILADIR